MRMDDTAAAAMRLPQSRREQGRGSSGDAAGASGTGGAGSAGMSAVDGRWQLEMERAWQDSWHCEATAPGDAAAAADAPRRPAGAEHGQDGLGVSVVAGLIAGRPEVPVQPYGLSAEPPHTSGQTSGEGMPSTPTEVGPANARPGEPVEAQQARSSASSSAMSMSPPFADDPMSQSVRPEGRGAEHAPHTGSDLPEAGPSSSGQSSTGPSTTTSAASQVASRAPVRLHVESEPQGRLNAWLGVDRGAEAQAAVVLATLREDAQCRGETIGAVHINGRDRQQRPAPQHSGRDATRAATSGTKLNTAAGTTPGGLHHSFHHIIHTGDL